MAALCNASRKSIVHGMPSVAFIAVKLSVFQGVPDKLGRGKLMASSAPAAC